MKKQNRLPWEGFLLLALYIALPSYLALELKAGLPLLTASRLLLVLAGVGVLLRNRNINAIGKGLLLTADKPLMVCLFVYFALLIGVNVTHMSRSSEGIKQIFVIVAEEYGLAFVLTMLLNSRERVMQALKILCVVSGVLGILACVTVLFNYNIFHLLDTAGRNELVVRNFYRYGMLRPTAGFHHAVYYGAFCGVMLPIQMYFTEGEQTPKARRFHAICTALNLTGLVLSNSRGSQLAFVCLAGLIFFIRLWKRQLAQLFKTYLPIMIIAVVITGIVFVACPAGQQRIENALQTQQPAATQPTQETQPGETVEPTETKPQIDTSFGENPDGLRSRFIQLSGITYTLGISPMNGLGPNAHMEGRVAYEYKTGKWVNLKTVDVNVVAIVIQYGLVGLLGFVALYGSLAWTFLRKDHRSDPLMHHLFLAFLCYLLCSLSISSLDKWLWVFIGITVALVNVMKGEREVC